MHSRDHNRHVYPLPGRPSVILAALCFGVYWLNVVAGRLAVSGVWHPPFLFGGIVEFCLLFVSAMALVTAALQRERARPCHEPFDDRND